MALITNLISFWSLNEASGGAIDAHGSNHLTEGGTVGSATGLVYGTARDFETSDTADIFTHTDNASLSTGDIDWSIASWIKPESIGAAITVVSKLGTSNAEYLLEIQSSGIVRLRVFGSSGYASESNINANAFGSLSAGTWYLLIAWHDSVNNEIGLAINASTPDMTAHSTGTFDSVEDFQIGGQIPYAQWFDGLIGPVAFWKRVLTSGERTALYNGGAGLPYSGFGGGPTILVVLGGTFTITGGAAFLARTRILVATGGSFAVTSGAVAFLHSRKLVAGTGSFALVGGNASLIKVIQGLLVAGSGLFVVTGGPVSLLHSRKLIAGKGTFLLLGGSASLINSESPEVRVPDPFRSTADRVGPDPYRSTARKLAS